MLKVDYIVNSFFDSITWLLSDEGAAGFDFLIDAKHHCYGKNKE